MCQKWFLRLWCIRHKLCIYLATKLTLSPNRPKRDSIWQTSSRSSIGCVQIDFLTYGTLHATVQLSCIKISTISEQTKSSLHFSLFNYEYHRVRLKWFLSLWCIRRKPCTYILPKQTLSLNKPKQDSIWHTSLRIYIRCVLIDFLSISFVPCRPCIYLASRLALCANRPNRASTWAPSLRSTNKCVQNGFLDYGALGAKCAPILHQN